MNHLRNYSSGSSALATYDRIKAMLRKAGATEVSREMIDEGPGWTVAIRFRLPELAGDTSIRLPVYPQAVYDWLYSGTKRPGPETRAHLRVQADRTAMKLTEDWLALQLTFVALHRRTLRWAFGLYLDQEEPWKTTQKSDAES